MKKQKYNSEFDYYVNEYENLMEGQLSFFKEKHSYFSEYKIKTLKEIFNENVPSKILDYGSGIGLSIPFFKKYFPNSEISCTDLSAMSLDFISQNHTDIKIIYPDNLSNYKFDLIFLSCVIHHIPIEERNEVFHLLYKILNPNGKVCIFEHNPYNPLTQWMVSTCPFDKDAQLISRGNLIKRLQSTNFFKHVIGNYTLFFPKFLSFFRPMEKFLGKIPLGGQYYAVFERTS